MKVQKLQWIRKEEEECGVKPTVTEKDIEQVLIQLKELELSKENRLKDKVDWSNCHLHCSYCTSVLSVEAMNGQSLINLHIVFDVCTYLVALFINVVCWIFHPLVLMHDFGKGNFHH